MQKNSCFREFIKYSSLNVLGMIGLSCYILADTFFVSKAWGQTGWQPSTLPSRCTASSTEAD